MVAYTAHVPSFADTWGWVMVSICCFVLQKVKMQLISLVFVFDRLRVTYIGFDRLNRLRSEKTKKSDTFFKIIMIC